MIDYTAMKELKPCPVCDATIVRHFYNDYNAISVGCQNCRFETRDHRTEEDAAREWNSLPRKLPYTKEKPKEEGWYWCKNGKNLMIVEITKILLGELSAVVGNIAYPLDAFDDCKWAGPIREPIEVDR